MWPADDGRGFRIVTDDGDYAADQVVIATGAYDRPRVPDFASDLDPAITQLHSSEFQGTSQLRDGTVLVVGASNSGAEIALMAAREHSTVLVGRDVGKMPFRPEDRLARTFDTFFWFFVNHVATLDNPIGRKAAHGIRHHGLPLDRVRPADLARRRRRTRPGPNRWRQATGCRCSRMAGSSRPPMSCGPLASGSDHEWIHLPITGPDGWPRQTRGVVTDVPRLFFIGLPFMYAGASALLGGVGRDAAYLVDRMARQAAEVRSSPDREIAAV